MDVAALQAHGMMYGTAWKEEETARLTRMALDAGFLAIDTANQRKHYHEAGVGVAVASALDDGVITREGLFLQTKFTYRRGQDHRLPYDPDAPVADQVRQSCASSLEHLGVRYIDSYVLHGPATRTGLTDDDWRVWAAMEALLDEGTVRRLGVSNVSAAQLRSLCEGAVVKPTFCQNRCYASRGWDAEVRRVCDDHGVVYQGFSLLTANRSVWHGAAVRALAARHGATPAQILFRFAQRMGMLPLTGTTDAAHMRADLAACGLALTGDELRTIQAA